MRQDGPYGLGVDLGTSNTVAVLHTPDGRTRPLLFDGQPLMPSGVFLDQQGRLHVGRDAQRLAQADPARYEPNPKRRIDETSVLLGTGEVPVVDLLAALLGAVARAAVETVGFLPPAMVTHPAAWGPVRRNVLNQAVARAGWPPSTRFTPEPVAAARYFAEVLSRPVPVGSSLAVFDFGGGTLDVAVVRNDGHGPTGRPVFSVISSGGVADLGGLDLDAALVEQVGRSLTGPPPQGGPDGPTQQLNLGAAAAWQALARPSSTTQWRNRRQLWDDVRGAKEMLSRTTVAPVAVPGVEHAVHLTREELEHVVTPLLRRGVHEAAGVIRAAGIAPNQLAGLFLVGGSSRVPMVGRLLHSDLHIPPTVLEQPELPVAEGALAELLAAAPQPVSPAPVSGPPVSGPPVSGSPASGPPASGPPAYGPPVPMSGAPMPSPAPRSRRPLLLAGLAAAVVLIVLVTAGVVYFGPWGRAAPVAFSKLDEGTTFPAIADKPDSSAYYFYTSVAGDRAYAAAQRPDKSLEITAIDLAKNQEAWRKVTPQLTAINWSALYATDRYVIADGDASGDLARPLVVYGKDGTPLWNRSLASEDTFLIFNDVLLLIDAEQRKLIGLDLSDGSERWNFAVPSDKSYTYYRIAPVGSAADFSGPADASGTPMGWNTESAQRFVLISSDKKARVFDADGTVTSEGTVAVEPSDLSLSIGVQIVADSERLYIGTKSTGYRIDAYKLDALGDKPVVVYNGAAERELKMLITCGGGRICLADVAEDGSDEVAAVQPSDTGGTEAWRKPAAGLTSFSDTGVIVSTDTGLLVRHKEKGGSFQSALFDKDGTAVFDLNGVAARVNPRSFLLFDREPSGATSAEGVPVSAVVDNGDNPTQIGTLPEARLSTCSWNETTIICASGTNSFRVQHFAAG
ncbi:Hsp70 family protein [Catenuloplanes sp. NPDC051500]|uniref:Hsp70 family protein n=1 Tax=Catenuloplanes sp. NPDC051500 TaxID=3363959 RepID=UPI003789C599